MPYRIAYVIGGSINSKNDYLIDAGQYPRFEYNLFLSRNDADPLTFDQLDHSRSIASRFWHKIDKPLFSLAALTHERALKYDCILASGEDVGIPIALGAIFDALTIPIYVITHGSYFGSPKFKPVASLLRRQSNLHFLCLSETLRRQMIDEFGFAEDRVHNTGYGIDCDFFAPRSSAETPVIASAGTATRDYKTLVEATRGLDIDVKIAADSTWFPTAIDLDGKELPVNVEARSYGNYVGLRDLYARSAFVVVPLYPARHACGYAVIAEAMAMGKAVIATKTQSYSDFIVEGETGLYAKSGDSKDLRAKIEQLLSNPAATRAMGEAGRARMAKEFSTEAYCRKIESVIGAKPVEQKVAEC